MCRTSGVPLTVAYYRRFWPVVQKMKALLAENGIGRVVSARVQLADYFDGDPKRLWLTSLREAGGGALANAGSHWVDLIRYLLGEVTEVMAYCSSTAGFEVEDTAVAIMRTETEAFVSFSSTWQERVGVNDVDICGTHGRTVASPLSAGRLKLFRFGKEQELFELARSGPAHHELIQELITPLQTGQSSPVPGEEAVAAWRIIEATHRSNTEGCRIKIV
ncbi:MAG: Gfo/Idh/MocA family oxidoreductase [Chloroflexi bacterium]|nr:Gfo/Idh/MocA family oxidoreductase [Chloroflexota bacterium]